MGIRFVLFVAMAMGMSLPAGAADAPFCVVSDLGRDCLFYDVVTCRQRAEIVRGMCVANSGTSGPQTTRSPQGIDFGAVTRGRRQAQEDIQAEQRARQEAQEHDARMRLLEAQAEAARANTAPTAPPAARPPVAPAAHGSQNEVFGTASVLHSACTIFVQSQQQGIGQDVYFYASYCYGMVRGFIAAHQIQTARGAPPVFCTGDASYRDIIQKLIAVPPNDQSEVDVQYLGVRLRDDWPC